MSLYININNDYNSKSLLFSIPVHEKQDIINNQIENIFNFNPGCKIILHINQSFKDFHYEKSNYSNLYFHQTNIPYKHGHDLLAYHIANFNYCMEKNINFEYFILCASNELFIQKGSIQQIQKYKNGLQIIEYSKNNLWHNFNKDLDFNNKIIELLSEINETTFCGGQAEGQYFQKNIFQKISDIYLKITQNNKDLLTFEAEEIIPQTIFKSFNIKNIGLPLTLQNYSNQIEFNIPIIQQFINGIIIKDNTKKKALKSPHINKNSKNNVFSIKRIDREFNELRNYLTQKGWLLNQNNFIKDYFYYSCNSSIQIKDKDHFIFCKKHHKIKDFQWVGYNLPKGNYTLSFDFKSNIYLNNYMNVGLKLHYPNIYFYTHFLKNLKINMFHQVKLNIFNKNNQDILFIFDELNHSINFEVKNIKFEQDYSLFDQRFKKNICIIFYQNDENEDFYLNNLNELIICIFKNIYNVYIIVFLYNNNISEHLIYDLLNPNLIYYFTNKNIYHEIFSSFDKINNKNEFHYIHIQNLNYLYLKPISEFNIIFNKVNFLNYQLNNQYNYDLNLDFLIIPNVFIPLINQYFIQKLYNKFSLLFYLNKNNIQYNKLINDFHIDSTLLEFKPKKKMKITKYGFLFHHNFVLHLEYFNRFCYFKKLNNNHFYFYKKKFTQSQKFIWCGKHLSFYKDSDIHCNIQISFYFKNNIPIIFHKKDFGLKIHEPLIYYQDWLKSCILYEFTFIQLNFKIQKKNQLIIFNFDHYKDEIDFEIKDFKIIVDYN